MANTQRLNKNKICSSLQAVPWPGGGAVWGDGPQVQRCGSVQTQQDHWWTEACVPGGGPGRLHQGEGWPWSWWCHDGVQSSRSSVSSLCQKPADGFSAQNLTAEWAEAMVLPGVSEHCPEAVILQRLMSWPLWCSSAQFAVLMWILTYVGAFFNGLTLIILGEEHFPQCPRV